MVARVGCPDGRRWRAAAASICCYGVRWGRRAGAEMDPDPNCVRKIKGTSDTTWADGTVEDVDGRAAWCSALKSGAVDV